MGAQRGDRGGIVLGWLTRIVIVLAVFGLIGFEAVAIGVAHVRTQDVAAEAARAGSAQFSRSKDVDRAYEAASGVAAENNGTIAPEDFMVEEDGTVEVTVHREARSVILRRFGATRRWLQVRESARARFVG